MGVYNLVNKLLTGFISPFKLIEVYIIQKMSLVFDENVAVYISIYYSNIKDYKGASNEGEGVVLENMEQEQVIGLGIL